MFTQRNLGLLPSYRYPLVNYRSIEVIPYNPAEWHYFYREGSKYFIVPDAVYVKMEKTDAGRKEIKVKKIRKFSTMDFGGNEEEHIDSIGLIRGFLKNTKYFTEAQHEGKQDVHRVLNTDTGREVPGFTTQAITVNLEYIGFREGETPRDFIVKFNSHIPSLLKVLSREREYLKNEKITNITITESITKGKEDEFVLHMETEKFNPKYGPVKY